MVFQPAASIELPKQNSSGAQPLSSQVEGKSFFLNKIKATTSNQSTSALNVNFATQSTAFTNLNLLDKQPTSQISQTHTSNKSYLSHDPHHIDLNKSNMNNGGETFDIEMKKHGLINDLKKLDSFNKFIEKHSPSPNTR